MILKEAALNLKDYLCVTDEQFVEKVEEYTTEFKFYGLFSLSMNKYLNMVEIRFRYEQYDDLKLCITDKFNNFSQEDFNKLKNIIYKLPPVKQHMRDVKIKKIKEKL